MDSDSFDGGVDDELYSPRIVAFGAGDGLVVEFDSIGVDGFAGRAAEVEDAEEAALDAAALRVDEVGVLAVPGVVIDGIGWTDSEEESDPDAELEVAPAAEDSFGVFFDSARTVEVAAVWALELQEAFGSGV